MSARFSPGKALICGAVLLVVLAVLAFPMLRFPKSENHCWTGAFLADRPTAALVRQFSLDYGKGPAVVLMFLDWDRYPDESVLDDLDAAGSVPMVTWEPWNAETQRGLDWGALLAGDFDPYVQKFALRLKAYGKPVFLRFAHEMNGDWYPWAGQSMGPGIYQNVYRHIWRIFSDAGAENVRWVFSINAENVPAENDYASCYPGDSFVDYIGLDGYNWGTTQSWSSWKGFDSIFGDVYEDVIRAYGKPVILSEFGSTSAGGDKARWIAEALDQIRMMPEIKGFVLFNIDKETDWRFVPGSLAGEALRRAIASSYFRGRLDI